MDAMKRTGVTHCVSKAAGCVAYSAGEASKESFVSYLVCACFGWKGIGFGFEVGVGLRMKFNWK
jgi:hypothetical protein